MNLPHTSSAVDAALTGTRVGDAFGQRFLEPGADVHRQQRTLPDAPWSYTDDTVLTCVLAEHLRARGAVDVDRLAREFTSAWAADQQLHLTASQHWPMITSKLTGSARA